MQELNGEYNIGTNQEIKWADLWRKTPDNPHDINTIPLSDDLRNGNQVRIYCFYIYSYRNGKKLMQMGSRNILFISSPRCISKNTNGYG